MHCIAEGYVHDAGPGQRAMHCIAEGYVMPAKPQAGIAATAGGPIPILYDPAACLTDMVHAQV